MPDLTREQESERDAAEQAVADLMTLAEWLEAENDALNAALRTAHELSARTASDYSTKLEADVRALREALEEHGEHRAGCGVEFVDWKTPPVCTCGLDAALKGPDHA